MIADGSISPRRKGTHLPREHTIGAEAEGVHLPVLSGKGQSASTPTLRTSKGKIKQGIQALEAFGIASKAVEKNTSAAPLHQPEKCFHVADLWSNRQQKEFLKMLDLQHADLVRERRQRIFALNSEETVISHTTKLATQIARSSKKISLRIELKQDIDAVSSPRNKRSGTRKQQLSDLNSFIGRLSNTIDSYRGRDSMGTEDIPTGGTTPRAKEAQ